MPFGPDTFSSDTFSHDDNSFSRSRGHLGLPQGSAARYGFLVRNPDLLGIVESLANNWEYDKMQSMQNARQLFLLVISVTFCCNFSYSAQEDSAGTVPKVAIVWHKFDSESRAAVLGQLQISVLGKRTFIQGKVLYAGWQNEIGGTTLWIPIDSITRILEFKTENEAIRAAKSLAKEDPKAGEAINSREKNQKQIFWKAAYDTAFKEASANSMPMMLFFVRPDAKPVQKLEHAMNQDVRIASLLNTRFMTLKIDALKETNIARAFDINLFPTLIITDSSGIIRERIIGYQDPETLLKILTQFLKQYERKMPKAVDASLGN